MDIWKEFDECVKKLFRFTNGKQVVIWGCDRGGLFLQHLFARANRNIKYVVDDASLYPKIQVFRSIEFKNAGLTSRNCAVIVANERRSEIDDFLTALGFEENVSYIYVDILFSLKNVGEGASYFAYLEDRFGVDIIVQKTKEEMERPREDCLRYSGGLGYTLVDVLDQFVLSIDDSVFDFGCGKGGALCLFQRYGVGRLGGVEYDKQLYSVLLSNFEKLGLPANGLINGDAALIREELDQYNYFFFYNPFQGDTFKRAIQNVEASFRRRNRKITIIYSGPYCHSDVVEHGVFQLTKQIYTDYSVRNVNIYTAE